MLVVALTALWLSVFALTLLLGLLWLPRGGRCPCCAEPTLLLRSRLVRLLPGRFESRWCLQCGWEGLVRPRRRMRWSVEWDPSGASGRPDTEEGVRGEGRG
jgi:hypothetical protein